MKLDFFPSVPNFQDWSNMVLQVLVRNVPPDPDESVTECVEHFFLVNHPDHYLTHQVLLVLRLAADLFSGV